VITKACAGDVAEHGKDYSNAENITAHLRLKDWPGKEIGTGISRAYWLDSTMDMVEGS